MRSSPLSSRAPIDLLRHFLPLALSLSGLVVVSESVRAATPIQLTTEGGRHPTVSSDGAWVAFTRLSFSGISRISADAGTLESLSSTGSGPDWSWANGLIAISAGSSAGILDPITKVISLASTATTDGPPAWSPSGTEIAVRKTSGGDGILIIQYPGGTSSILPCTDNIGATCEGEGPTWSPDGEWIAFEDGLEILKVRRSGGTAEIVAAGETIDGGVRDVTEPSWSPDGGWIAFVMEDETPSNSHIWVADSRGMQFGLFQVTSGTALDRAPTWSPASDRIYFASDRSGRSEIWSVAFEPPPLEARAFLRDGHRTIPLGAGPPACIRLEPVNDSFSLEDVDVGSVRLNSPGTGAVESIPSAGTKTLTVSDTDRNGIDDLSICFTREDLGLLFAGITGRRVVDATLEGSLNAGGSFLAPLTMTVVGPVGSEALAVPNPVPAGSALRIRLGGVARHASAVEIFDVSGRLVRRLGPLGPDDMGLLVIPFDGRDGRGRALPSGVYLFRIPTDRGTVAGRFAFVR